MNKELTICIAEDDDGHASLVQRNLRRCGLDNEILRFCDGQEALDFFLGSGPGQHRKDNFHYILLLDIRMPKVDGVEVLRRIKQDGELCKMPVIMLTTTDDPREVEKCHLLGCSSYIAKPVDYAAFVDVIKQLGFFIKLVEVPRLNGAKPD